MSMIIYGVHPVEEILASAPDQVRGLYAKDWSGSRFERLRELAEASGIVFEKADEAMLDRLSEGGNHQGVAARLDDFAYTPLSEVLAATEDASSAALLVLDGVQDPHNFGALVRTAAAFGVAGVVIRRDRAVGVTHSVVRASSGLAFKVPIVEVTNIARTLEELAENGWWSVAAVMDGEPVWDVDMVMKAAIVMGAEGDGVSRLVDEKCDFRARIPIAPGVESLNVSVAGGMMLFEWARQNR